MKKLAVIIALAVILTGCTDPVRVEKANAIRRESEAAYMATATAVAIEERVADVAISATATMIADTEIVRAETRDERMERQETVIKWSGRIAVGWMLLVLVVAGIFAIGRSIADSRKANLESQLVRIDKTTRTWPVLLDTKTGMLVDLETGERARLDSVQEIDHRRLIISGQARVTGLLAQSAENIAKTTGDAGPGDMLPGIGTSVPLLRLEEPKEEES